MLRVGKRQQNFSGKKKRHQAKLLETTCHNQNTVINFVEPYIRANAHSIISGAVQNIVKIDFVSTRDPMHSQNRIKVRKIKGL